MFQFKHLVCFLCSTMNKIWVYKNRRSSFFAFIYIFNSNLFFNNLLLVWVIGRGVYLPLFSKPLLLKTMHKPLGTKDVWMFSILGKERIPAGQHFAVSFAVFVVS